MLSVLLQTPSPHLSGFKLFKLYEEEEKRGERKAKRGGRVGSSMDLFRISPDSIKFKRLMPILSGWLARLGPASVGRGWFPYRVVSRVTYVLRVFNPSTK